MITPFKFNSVPSSASRQKGFTLLEALVAFLLLSVGMLGVGSLQLISLKAGHTAAFRSVAVIKVEEMFERIRNNPSQVLNYDSTATVANNNACNDYITLNSCLNTALVAYDIFEWEQGLTSSMTANAGVTTNIVVTPPVPGTQPLAVVVITVNWQERNLDTQVMDTMNYSASADICTTTAC